MENPWSQLPTDAPHVLPSDRCIVEKFNARYADKHDPKCGSPSCTGCFTLQKQLLPEPFIRDPDARVTAPRSDAARFRADLDALVDQSVDLRSTR